MSNEAKLRVAVETIGRGLHSFTSLLNLSASCGMVVHSEVV
jgi:hypothetical protein